MAHSLLYLSLIALLGYPVRAYLDLGDVTLPKVTAHTPTIPHHLHPPDQTARIAGTATAMITAIAPSISMLPNGIFETYYSMHFQKQVPRRKIGKGIFERGVFASDPPFPTCNVCDANGNPISTRTSLSGTASTGAPTCTTIPYAGVFRSPDPAQTTYCFDTSYTGVFSTSIPYTYVLPCCPSCAPNSTNSSTSRSITTGVFVTTTTFMSDGTASTFSATPSSISSSIVPSSASSSNLPSGGSSSMTTTSRARPTSPIPSPGPSTSSSGSSSTSTTPSNSVIVISSTTIIVGPSTSRSALSTITVITATPSTTTPAVTPSVNILAPDTIIGCGTAVNGCGTVIGSGVVYFDTLGLVKVTSIGTAIGCAPKVVGCGTMLATQGTFTGSATIYGCGTASGTATLVGAGTVWPAIAGGLLSVVSSGTITGSGSVVGCGTIIGSGAFTATAPFSISVPTTATPTKTVEIYVSYCPTNMPNGGGAYDMPRIGGNLTFPAANDSTTATKNAPYRILNSTALLPNSTTYPLLNTTTNYTKPTNDVIPACKQCPNSALCCAYNAVCDADGKCPHWAIAAMGYWRFDVNQVTQRNLSDGTQGPEETDQELRMLNGVGMMEMGGGDGIGVASGSESGGMIADGVLEGLSGGKVETAPAVVGNRTAGRYGMGNGTSEAREKNETGSPFNGFVVKDDNVFFSH